MNKQYLIQTYVNNAEGEDDLRLFSSKENASMYMKEEMLAVSPVPITFVVRVFVGNNPEADTRVVITNNGALINFSVGDELSYE
jgi:hypothetical protein